MPPGIVLVFREQLYQLVFLVLLKERVLYHIWYFRVLFQRTVFTSPHSLTSPDKVSITGIVSHKSKL